VMMFVVDRIVCHLMMNVVDFSMDFDWLLIIHYDVHIDHHSLMVLIDLRDVE
jgi:hypothetical protein